MANITTCTGCGHAYEAGSEEQANEAERFCFECRGADQGPPRRCRVCDCTDDDCSGCVRRTGAPCHWVGRNLCSACA